MAHDYGSASYQCQIRGGGGGTDSWGGGGGGLWSLSSEVLYYIWSENPI